jgi:hypothetical protein
MIYISYVSCASIAESLNSSNHNSLDHDCVGPAQSLNALLDSLNNVLETLYNLNTKRIMDELVRVNIEIDRMSLDNEMKRIELHITK